jgi:hypothetical protein
LFGAAAAAAACREPRDREERARTTAAAGRPLTDSIAKPSAHDDELRDAGVVCGPTKYTARKL